MRGIGGEIVRHGGFVEGEFVCGEDTFPASVDALIEKGFGSALKGFDQAGIGFFCLVAHGFQADALGYFVEHVIRDRDIEKVGDAVNFGGKIGE